MLRLLVWLISGYWLPSPRTTCVAIVGDSYSLRRCEASVSACSSHYCLRHCARYCYCGVGETARAAEKLICDEADYEGKT